MKFFINNFKISFLVFLKKIFFLIKIFFTNNSIRYNSNASKIKHNAYKENTLIFSPEGIFSSHQKMSLELATLLKKVSNVFFFKCLNDFPQCMYKINRSFWWSDISYFKNKQEINECNNCIKKSEKFLIDNNFNTITNSDINNPNIKIEVSKIKNLSFQEIKNYSYENINIYNLVLYDYYIVFKKDKFYEPNKKEAEFIKKQLINNIIAISTIKEICQKFKISSIFMIDEYSFQSSIRAWCKLNNVKVFFYQNSYSIKEELEFTPVSSWPLRISDYKNNWEIFKNLPVSSQMVDDTYSNLLLRMQNRATHIFSKSYNKEVILDKINGLKIDNTKKIIGLFTSSDDEERAIAQNINFFEENYNYNDVFDTQEEWIDKTINFVEKSNDYQLIVVIHPRLYKSLNSPRVSANYNYLYKKYGQKSYKNVTVVWPENNISTYNVIELIDFATVSWSSIGIEISLLGIPVVTGIERYFPITVNFEGIKKTSSIDDYFNFFQRKYSFESEKYLKRIKKSIRWFNLLTFGNSLHEYYCKDQTKTMEYLLKNNNPINLNIKEISESKLQDYDEKSETNAIYEAFTRIQKGLNLASKNSSLSKSISSIIK